MSRLVVKLAHYQNFPPLVCSILRSNRSFPRMYELNSKTPAPIEKWEYPVRTLSDLQVRNCYLSPSPEYEYRFFSRKLNFSEARLFFFFFSQFLSSPCFSCPFSRLWQFLFLFVHRKVSLLWCIKFSFICNFTLIF